MQIKKGDKFRCIKTLFMKPYGNIGYVQGKIYTSDKDGCLTNCEGLLEHYWDTDELFYTHFEPMIESTEEKPDNSFLRVRITGCSNLGYWYADAIGDIYDVEKINGVYSVDYARYILIQDAEIIEEPKEYIEMRGVDPDEEESPKDILREEIRTFETGAVRDSNKGKSRPDLISPYFTNRLGFRLAYGIEKGYGENNWKKGIPNEAFLESLERHLVAYKMGKTDEDHAAAIAFNIMGIIHNEEVAKL
jgi:hypothetical protein